MITPEMLARTGSEDGEQAALFCWAAAAARAGMHQLRWMYAIPNGGSRHIAEATKLKATGVKSGVADIFLPVPMSPIIGNCFTSQSFHGLYIEMKRVNGVPSDWKLEQREFCNFVESQGYAYFVAYGWKEAVIIIESYLNAKTLRRSADGRLCQT